MKISNGYSQANLCFLQFWGHWGLSFPVMGSWGSAHCPYQRWPVLPTAAFTVNNTLLLLIWFDLISQSHNPGLDINNNYFQILDLSTCFSCHYHLYIFVPWFQFLPTSLSSTLFHSASIQEPYFFLSFPHSIIPNASPSPPRLSPTVHRPQRNCTSKPADCAYLRTHFLHQAISPPHLQERKWKLGASLSEPHWRETWKWDRKLSMEYSINHGSTYVNI